MPTQPSDTKPVKIDHTKIVNKSGVEVMSTPEGIEIILEDIQVEKIRDQKQQMIQAIGCYNNPGGPTC